MTRPARLWTLAAVVASAALSVPLSPAAAPATARSARSVADTLAISVDDVSPTILPTDAKPAPLTVTLTVTNRSNADLSGLSIEGERGEPLTSQTQLDDAIKHVAPPVGHIVPIEPTKPVRFDLAAGASEQVVFRSTTSTSTDSGLCNCAQPNQPWVYPLYFTGHVKGPGGVDQVLGLADTFVSAFNQRPAPVHVSWVWPLLEQPHLLDDTPVGTGGPVFTDDFLAAAVATGGRLARALGVLEQVAHDTPDVPVTLLIDPELLDELEIMATGPYQVRTATNRLVPGTGRTPATAWLQRLRALLTAAPQFRLELTPYADPDVQSLDQANLTWSAGLPPAMQRRVAAALGNRAAEHTLAWPAGGTLTRRTLGQLVEDGVSTVLLQRAQLAPKPAAGFVRPGLARLSSHGHDVGVGLLDPAVQHYVEQTVTAGAPGAALLPQLMSELTIQAAQEPTTPHVAVLAPPRWVDPDVATAARTIEQTSRSLATRPLSLADAVGGELLPNGRSRLPTTAPASAGTLPQTSVATAAKVAADLPALRGLLTPESPKTPFDPQAKALLAELPIAGQRVASSAWGRPGNDKSAARFAELLATRVDGLTHGVTIVTPSSGSYTLASQNSPLPITVENNLPYPVTVMIQVTPVNGLPGFSAKPATEDVEAHQKATLHLPTNVDRTGRIRVVAALYTADGKHRIGYAVEMTVRSTALGVIGVIITVVAGAVLVLALLIRFGRRLRHRWSRNVPDRPRWDPDLPPGGPPRARAARPARSRQPAERAP